MPSAIHLAEIFFGVPSVGRTVARAVLHQKYCVREQGSIGD
jgi:hypothetical protein